VLRDLITESRAVLSTQVLQEFFVNATRELGVPAEIARKKVELLRRLEVVLVRPEMILSAIDLHRLHGLSFWDALIVRSAADAGCARVLSEDMGHGQVFDGVRIDNPFR
jgi:predicted nucleic acid-binding protein